MAGEQTPTYPVIKDLFDTIDIRQDGVLDLHEWQQTFGRVAKVNNKLSIKPTPLAMWENSREFEKIGALIARSRKHLVEQFQAILGAEKLFTFEQGKKALDNWLYTHFGDRVRDDQLLCLFRAAQIQAESQQTPKYDYLQFLDIYKQRHTGPQL